eukprot:COSAG04_NODE_7024_length_1207_cov_1.224729_1_plen_80_part_00
MERETDEEKPGGGPARFPGLRTHISRASVPQGPSGTSRGQARSILHGPPHEWFIVYMMLAGPSRRDGENALDFRSPRSS